MILRIYHFEIYLRIYANSVTVIVLQYKKHQSL